jgi:SNF2 family DNA or RNA helicase
MVSAIREASHKTIVFVPFRHAIELVRARLDKEGISAETINGAVSAGKRATIFNNFQKEVDPHVLVVQPQSAAHGVTLTAANTIVWFGPIASVETWLQANERINRPSQLNKMTVIKLTGSPVEKKVYRALEAKELAHKQLTSLYEDELHDE